MKTEQQFKRIITKALDLLKQKGIKITALTAYNIITAKILGLLSTFVTVLEKIPAELAKHITKMLKTPAVGIDADF